MYKIQGKINFDLELHYDSSVSCCQSHIMAEKGVGQFAAADSPQLTCITNSFWDNCSGSCFRFESWLGRWSTHLGWWATGTHGHWDSSQPWGFLTWEGWNLKQDKTHCNSFGASGPRASWPWGGQLGRVVTFRVEKSYQDMQRKHTRYKS